jgi:hypothetical protein
MPKARRDPFFITNAVLNPLLLTLLKSKAGLILGRRLAVVEYTGRRDGKPHELVAQYQLEGSTVRMTVGMPDRKQWWRNFNTDHPMTLRLAGRKYVTHAHVVRNREAVLVLADLHVTQPANQPIRTPTAASRVRDLRAPAAVRAARPVPPLHGRRPGADMTTAAKPRFLTAYGACQGAPRARGESARTQKEQS